MRWPIYKGRDRVAWAIIDDADVTLVADHLWRLSAQGYAYRAEHMPFSADARAAA